jgi:hypothetical protein
MLNFELSRLVKQQCSNYLRSKYGALHNGSTPPEILILSGILAVSPLLLHEI